MVIEYMVSRSCGGDPAAAERYTVSGSSPSLSTTQTAPRRCRGPKPAPAVCAVKSTLHKYYLPMEVSFEGPPTPTKEFEDTLVWNVARGAYNPLTSVPCASLQMRNQMAFGPTGSGETAALFLLTEVTAASGGRGGGGTRRDMDPYGHATPRFFLIVLASAQLWDLLMGYDIHVVKYHVMDAADRMFIGFELKIVNMVDGSGVLRKPARRSMLFTGTFSSGIEEPNSPSYWHFKGLPKTVIHGGETEELNALDTAVDTCFATAGHFVDMLQGSRVSVKAIQDLVIDEADRILYVGSEPQSKDYAHRSIASLRSYIKLVIFLFIIFSLLKSATGVESSFNITATMDRIEGYCPAPPFQSKFSSSPTWTPIQTLTPAPTPTPNMVDQSCWSLLTVVGAIFSVFSNCGLMLLIEKIGTVNDYRRKLVGISSVLFVEAYQFWILHLYQKKLSDICELICSMLLLMVHTTYWFIFWNKGRSVQIIVIGSIAVCVLGGISETCAGVFAIVFTVAGQISRVWSVQGNVNWVSCACVIIGIIGSVLQLKASRLHIKHMQLYQIGSLVVLAARLCEVVIHVICVSKEGWAKLIPPVPVLGKILTPVARRILRPNK